MTKKASSARVLLDRPTGEIINFYEQPGMKKYLDESDNPNFKHHNISLPFRMCVVAPSGSGKTNFLLNLIRVFSMGEGTFSDISIITQNKDEPLYNYLEGEFEQIKIKEGMSQTPKLDDMDKKYNHLVVWDDLVLAKTLDSVSNYYMRARKKNCSVIFLSQSYYDIPTFIRKNSNYLVILDLGGSKREITAIMNEWSGELLPYQLRAIYKDATSEHMRPLIIQGGKSEPNKKYRKSWLDYYDLNTFLKNVKDPKKSDKKQNNDIEEESDEDT